MAEPKVTFEDYRIQVKAAINSKIAAALHEAAGEMVSQTKRNTRVDTGQTKNSWAYKVIEDTAYIGSNHENAIWEEFGTGEYALNGNGRKGGWAYEDAKGNWHFTHGKKPTRAFFNTYTALKSRIIAMIQSKFKEIK